MRIHTGYIASSFILGEYRMNWVDIFGWDFKFKFVFCIFEKHETERNGYT